MSTGAFWWNAIGVFLLLLWVVQWALPGRARFVFAVAAAAILSVIPFFGHVPRHWLSGLTPNMSVPLFVMLTVSVTARAGVRGVFRRCEWQAAWIFGALAAAALYPSAFGLGAQNFDAYALGWPWLDTKGSLLLFGGVAMVSGFLVWRGNRFGWVLVASAVLFMTSLQESRNFWDYLLDPLYAVVSCGGVAVMLIRRLLRR